MQKWKSLFQNEVREKSRECHNHKPQSFPDTRIKNDSRHSGFKTLRIKNVRGIKKLETVKNDYHGRTKGEDCSHVKSI